MRISASAEGQADGRGRTGGGRTGGRAGSAWHAARPSGMKTVPASWKLSHAPGPCSGAREVSEKMAGLYRRIG